MCDTENLQISEMIASATTAAAAVAVATTALSPTKHTSSLLTLGPASPSAATEQQQQLLHQQMSMMANSKVIVPLDFLNMSLNSYGIGGGGGDDIITSEIVNTGSGPASIVNIDELFRENYALREKLKEMSSDRDRLLCEVSNLRLELDMAELKRLPEER